MIDREKLIELQKEAIRLFMEIQSDEQITDFIADHLIANGVRVSEPSEVRGKRMEQPQDELNKARSESDALRNALLQKDQELDILRAQMHVVKMIFGGQ